MSKLMLGFVAVLSLTAVGCKKKGGAAAEAMAKMEGFSKSMCDCKDKACADKVNEDMTKWGTEMAKNAGAAKDEKPDPEMAKKSADIMTKYTECMTKIMMAGATGGSDAAKPPEPAAGSDKKDEPAAGSDAKKDEPAAAGSDAKKDEPKKEEEKKDEKKEEEKKPDDKKAGGW